MHSVLISFNALFIYLYKWQIRSWETNLCVDCMPSIPKEDPEFETSNKGYLSTPGCYAAGSKYCSLVWILFKNIVYNGQFIINNV